MKRLKQAGFSLAAGFSAALAVALFSFFAFWPSRLGHFPPDQWPSLALLGALWSSGLGLATLFVAALRRPPQPVTAALWVAAVLLIQTLWRAVQPWQYYGHFPTWTLGRDFMPFLPSALAAGLVFGLVARRLGPNNSSKPTPLRGAA